MEQNVSALSQNVYFSCHVNNSMLECPVGSINFSQRLSFPQPKVPSRFIVKQDLDLPGLKFETRAKCREFVVRFKDDGVQCLSNGAPIKLAPPGHDQMFATTAPRVCEPHISDDELRQVICQASPLAQNRTANV